MTNKNLQQAKKNKNDEFYMTKINHYINHKFPEYDNYDVINVDKTADISCDYDGVMGVSITFLDKYNPDQFEIVGNEYDLNIEKGRGYINRKRMYSGIFIRRK